MESNRNRPGPDISREPGNTGAGEVLVNGNFITMRSRGDTADAVYIKSGRITAVGEKNRVLADADPDALRTDLGGRCVLPGFNDNHIHTIGLGNMHAMPDLNGLDAERIIQALVDHREREVPGPHGDWIVATNWDYVDCPNPSIDLLDRHFPDLPVMLFQFSGHAAWCNSEALRRLGIRGDRTIRGVEEVVLDEKGRPTGILKEPHGNRGVREKWVARVRDREHAKRAVEIATTKLAACGVTSVQDNTWFSPVQSAIRELRDSGRLTVRYGCWTHGEYPIERMVLEARRYDHEWMRKGPVKFFFDGAFSSHTAGLFEEYADEPGNFGNCLSAREIEAKIATRVRRRRQIAAHAIGDRAVHEYCLAVAALSKRFPFVRELRLRVEHAQLVSPLDIELLARLGMYVAAQPSALGNYEKDERILGTSRALRAYPYRSLIDAGVPLSFGSDSPGERSFEPLVGIRNAVTRPGDEAIGLYDAIRCYTVGSACAEGTEALKGTIEAGKLADLVVLDADPFSVPPDEISRIGVFATIVGGRWVHWRTVGSEAVPEIR